MFEIGEDLPGSFNNCSRETGELGDRDAVALVGRAFLELAHEEHLAVLFSNREAEVAAAVEKQGDVGEFVIVRGEESTRAATGESRVQSPESRIQNPDSRLEGTIAACVLAAYNGANIVRVHDVKPVVKALKLADAIGLRN